MLRQFVLLIICTCLLLLANVLCDDKHWEKANDANDQAQAEPGLLLEPINSNEAESEQVNSQSPATVHDESEPAASEQVYIREHDNNNDDEKNDDKNSDKNHENDSSNSDHKDNDNENNPSDNPITDPAEMEALESVRKYRDELNENEPWVEPNNKMGFISWAVSGFHEDYSVQYDKINEFLVRELKTDWNVGNNLALAEQWLESKRNGLMSQLYNKLLIGALEQFVALSKVLKVGVRCSREAYVILWKNNQATRGRAQRRRDQIVDPTRIVLLVNFISLRHSIECFNYYPSKLIELQNKMDRAVLARVQNYANMKVGFKCSIEDLRHANYYKAAVVAFHLIKPQAQSIKDPDVMYLGKVLDEIHAKRVVDPEGVKKLVKRYIVEPCREYVSQLGPDVFEPAQFGELVLNEDDKYTRESHAYFLDALLEYRLCKSLITRKEEKLIQGLIRFIDNKYPAKLGNRFIFNSFKLLNA